MKILLRTILLFSAFAGCSAFAFAQNPRLQIESLSHLEDKASKVVDVSIDQKLMDIVGRLIRKSDIKDEDAKKVAEAVAGIKEIYVRSYEFETEGQYSSADIEPIRAQVKADGWSRLVGVRSKKAGENAEVYMMSQGDKVLGFAIIAADPKELTVVNIIGTVDLERLSDLDGDFGVPRIELKRDPKTSGN